MGRGLQRSGDGLMKTAVIADVHANLPALRAALAAIRQEGCDRIVHLGDAIGIGPQPAECLELLCGLQGATLIMGNHDAHFAHGIPDPRPSWMGEGELRHQRWIHTQLDPDLRPVVARWPLLVDEELCGIRVRYQHYALVEGTCDFASVVQDADGEALEALFAPGEGRIVCYGHHHPFSDRASRTCRFINPGSLGCHDRAEARFTILDCDDERLAVRHRSVPYDDATLARDFERREVPERSFIDRAFFGGRLGFSIRDGATS